MGLADCQVARTVIGPDIVIVTVGSGSEMPPVHPANRYVVPDAAIWVGARSTTAWPAAYQPLPSTVPTSESTRRKYCRCQLAVALFAWFITIGAEVGPEPVASSVHPTNDSRTPAPRETSVDETLAKAGSPARYQPSPVASTYSLAKVGRYSVTYTAKTCLGPSIRIGSEMRPVPDASPPHRRNASRSPAPTAYSA